MLSRESYLETAMTCTQETGPNNLTYILDSTLFFVRFARGTKLDTMEASMVEGHHVPLLSSAARCMIRGFPVYVSVLRMNTSCAIYWNGVYGYLDKSTWRVKSYGPIETNPSA